MIRVPRIVLPLISGYGQKQIKLILLMLKNYNSNRIVHMLSRYMMYDAFGRNINVSDVSKKLVKSMQNDEDELKDKLIRYIRFTYPSCIEYDFRSEINTALESADKTACIEFDESLLAALPNTGYSLKLLLLLLFLTKNDSCTVSTEEAASLLFGNQTAYMPNKTNNATANQFTRLNNAVNDINACTDYAVSITPIKEHRAVSFWQFNIMTANNTKDDNTAVDWAVNQSLQKEQLDVPKSYKDFISLFCANEGEARSMVKDIAKETTELVRIGILDSSEVPDFFARKAALYAHANPTLWYTLPKAQMVLEQVIFTHPGQFAQEISVIIANCRSYQAMLQYLKNRESEPKRV